jgi:hypothetical protein
MKIIQYKSKLINQFDIDTYQNMISSISNNNNKSLDSKLKEMFLDQITSYCDLRFYFYKSLTSLAKNQTSDSISKNQNDASSSGLLDLLLIVSISHDVNQSNDNDERWVSNQTSKKEDSHHHEISDSDMNKAFSDCWLAMLRVPMSLKSLKSVLLAMDIHIIPKLNTPTLLSDFLTDAYNHGMYIHTVFL